MKNVALFFSLMVCYSLCKSQSLVGITGKKDTSYSTYSAYANTVLTHPNIKIVGEFKQASVSEKKHNLLQLCKAASKAGCVLSQKEK